MIKTLKEDHNIIKDPDESKTLPTEFLSLSELIRYIHRLLPPSKILRMVAEGEIPFHEQDGQYVFKQSEIDGWLELNQSDSPTKSSFINPLNFSNNERKF
ncbi:helix-turn-helix domain-containing protein [Maribellus sp. CM-23]|uniref:helix-turn-helix domain-containing protein n=1 Tax=Maribellus sp. CM-23 TaxID=2781026 RepID=UPI001F399111|nr:helix-turn-helix domain-containing protein [Maribellus sp. CM-23]MCE4564345.1 helix-turn-helix domain-containing protein [Maribellus sp. CM-23]